MLTSLFLRVCRCLPPSAAAAAAGVCQSQDFEFLRSVGAEDWVLPQHGVVFAQERPVGSDGPSR